MGKTLYKIRQGRIVSGVCMGLSEYLNLDVNVIRLLVVIFSCTGGVGLIAYIAAAILLPEKPAYEDYVATDAEARRIAKELIVKN